MKTDNLSGYGLIEVDHEGNHWRISMLGLFTNEALGSYLWPSGPPDSIVIQPTQPVGWFTITGLSDLAISDMDPWCAQWFSETGGGSSAPHSSTKTWAVVNSDGTVVQKLDGQPKHVQRAGIRSELEIEWWADLLYQATTGLPIEALLAAPRAIAQGTGSTVAIGIDGDLAYAAGLTAGNGIYFGPNDEFGEYGSMGVDFGFIIAASLSVAMTVVDGPPSNLAGPCQAFEVSVGEFIALSGALLYSMENGQYLGWAGEMGMGLGLPVNVFESISNTWIREVDLSPGP